MAGRRLPVSEFAQKTKVVRFLIGTIEKFSESIAY